MPKEVFSIKIPPVNLGTQKGLPSSNSDQFLLVKNYETKRLPVHNFPFVLWIERMVSTIF